MKSRRTPTILLLLLTSLSLDAGDYEIQLMRPSAVGDRYELKASGSLEKQMTLTAEGNPPRSRRALIAAELEGSATVLEIDDLQRESRVKLLISRFVVSNGGATEKKAALPRDTEVIGQRREGKKEFLVDGQAAAKDIAEILGLFFSLPAGQTSDDEIFGTPERRSVGDRWEVNGAAAVRDLAAEGLNVDARNILGGTTLNDVTLVDGRKCLHLSSNLEIRDLEAPVPPGLTLEKSTLSATFSGMLPVDASLQPLSGTEKSTLEMVAGGKLEPEAPRITWSIRETRTKVKKIRPLP